MRLLIINDFGIIGGGTENRIKGLIDFLFEKKVVEELHILLHRNNFNKEIYKNEAHKLLKVHTCEIKNSGKITAQIIKYHKIDLIQVHNLALLSIRPITAAKKLNKKIIFSAHDQWGYCGRRVLIDKHDRICTGPGIVKCTKCIGFKNFINVQKKRYYINKCDIGIEPSQFVIDMYEKNKILVNKWKKILPWHIFQAANNDKKENYILYIGTTKFYKGLHILINAMKIVTAKFPKVILKIAGADQYKNCESRTLIDTLIRKLDIEKNIEFLGYKSKNEINALMNKCSIFVMPSICQESSTLSVIEAMFSSCAIIVSASGGVPEIVADSGVVVKQNDSLDLAKAILLLLSDENTANNYRKKAYERAKNQFGFKNLNEVSDIYNTSLSISQ